MAIFKCKMCGGTLEISENQRTAVCEYCGTEQTLPRLDDDRRANLYDRANHFRRNNEFDKAMGIYEQILNEDGADAEAYWSIVLCRYGIEYVEDPASHKRVPTVNRAQFTSVFDDEDYKAAIANADGAQKTIYEAEAAAINEIQKGILAISRQEEPFDVFICYKETDANGRRTQDSVLANDLYHQLTQEGFKVFFARITLEDKLGTAYEPYIFAALNSAKVMVVIGTKPEYFNAVWVKNEWSRYLALIKGGAKKTLIPAYRDMDPYDLPEEFSHLQAQDMSKLGFMQDLIRGIKKIAAADAPKAAKETVVVQQSGGEVAPLLKRVFMYLEDGDWDSANTYCERVLDIDPECAEAYLGKLMAELHCRRREDLKNLGNTFDDKNNYKKALRFADDKLSSELTGDIAHIIRRNKTAVYNRALELMKNAETEAAFKTAAEVFGEIPGFEDADAKAAECLLRGKAAAYNRALELMKAAETENAFKTAAGAFREISGFEDADAKAAECLEKAEIARKDKILYLGKNRGSSRFELEAAIADFEKIPGWRDADQCAAECRAKIEEIEAERQRRREEARIAAEKQARKNKKMAVISAAAIVICIAVILLITKIIIPTGKYNKAVDMLADGRYDEAGAAFAALGDFKNSPEMMYEAYYAQGEALLAAGEYEEAAKVFETAGNTEQAIEIYSEYGEILLAAGEYEEAVKAFEAAGNTEQVNKAYYQYGEALYAAGEYEETAEVFEATGNIEIKYRAKGEFFLNEGNKVAAAIAFAKADTSDAKGKALALWNEVAHRETMSAGTAHTVGLKADGTVVAAGSNKYGQCDVGTWSDIVAVSAGGIHTVGLKADGTVVAVGYNDDGRCDVSAWTDIVAVSAGAGLTVGLKADGTVVAVCNNDCGQCDVSAWTDIVAVSAGDYHTIGLKADGTVVAAGSNKYGKCDVDAWTDIVAVSAGFAHTVGLKADGTVVAVGLENRRGDVSAWTDIVAVSAGDDHTVGLKSDGTVVAVGSNYYGQCDVDAWTDIVAVSAGDFYTVGLKADGRVVTVGKNDDGRRDVDAWTNIKLPVNETRE